MRRLLLLLVSILFLAAPAAAQGSGYGEIRFENQTNFDIDFSVNGVYACRAYKGSSCTTQVTPGTHYVSGKTVEATPRDVPGSNVTVEEDGSASFAATGGGAAPTGYGKIRFENETNFEIDFYIDNAYACRAWVRSYCEAQAAVGAHYVSGKTVETPPRESGQQTVTVEEGATTTYVASGGGAAATGYGTIRFENETRLEIDFYIDGAYACRGSAGSYCTAQATVGSHSVHGKTIEATPRATAYETLEVVEGGTTIIGWSGGGEASTGYGTLEFTNGTAFQADLYIDNAHACRADPNGACSVQTKTGAHQVHAALVEDNPRQADAITIDVPDSGTAFYEISGGGQPGEAATSKTRDATPAPLAHGETRSEAPPQPGPSPGPQPPDPGALRYGSIVFDNQTALVIDFYIDNAYACRTQPGGDCEFPAIAGRRNVFGLTQEAQPRRVEGTADVPAGGKGAFGVVGQGADALPPPH